MVHRLHRTVHLFICACNDDPTCPSPDSAQRRWSLLEGEHFIACKLKHHNSPGDNQSTKHVKLLNSTIKCSHSTLLVWLSNGLVDATSNPPSTPTCRWRGPISFHHLVWMQNLAAHQSRGPYLIYPGLINMPRAWLPIYQGRVLLFSHFLPAFPRLHHFRAALSMSFAPCNRFDQPRRFFFSSDPHILTSFK